MDSDTILITEKDYLRLDNLLISNSEYDFEDLEIELNRATIITDSDVPKDLVTMNTQCRFLDITNQKESLVTIVYPQNSQINESKVSILAPLGSALIGLRKDQEINWRFPSGKTKRLKVTEILYQPEAAGHWHL